MLEFINVENFQRHEQRRVDFDPRLTTVIGHTDAGKSSLLRAIRWVALNQPDGDAFIRHGSTGATATLRVDGHTIVRRRTAGGENKYYLDGQEFSAFGRGGVPDRIVAVLGVDKINFVGQKEPDFWFSLPSGEVARQLNSIVDLGVIDDALETIGRQLRQRQDAVKSAAERMTTSRGERDALAWVDDAELALARVSSAHDSVLAVDRQIAALGQIIQEIERLSFVCDAAAARQAAINDVGRAGASCLKIDAQITGLAALITGIEQHTAAAGYSGDITSLSDALAQWQTAFDQFGRLEYLIADIDRLERILSRPLGDFDGMSASLADFQTTGQAIRRLSMLITDIEDNYEAVQSAAGRVDALHQELERLTDGRCPLCGSEM